MKDVIVLNMEQFYEITTEFGIMSRLPIFIAGRWLPVLYLAEFNGIMNDWFLSYIWQNSMVP